ncbi:MAG: aminotransferase class I/II-fold pyridoxal phosphate-dependent enzyme, partial [Vulcanimicrobiaceae bacterium]
SDRLNHASLIDGVRSTRLTRHVYPHRQFPQQGRGREPALVVTESLFGVDGDVTDLCGIVASLGSGDVLFVDEAHALGVFGPDGRGLAFEIRDPRIVVMGTLSKAFGAHGGFVAGPESVIAFLQSAARAFIFDTALPPAVAEAARAGVRLAHDAGDARARLLHLSARLRKGLVALGYRVPDGSGPIVPVIVGDVTPALELAQRLRKHGINAPPIRPPTVPEGTCRLRITLRATHGDADVDRLLAALA